MKQDVADKVAQYFAGFDEKHFDKGQILTLAGEEPKGISFLVEGNVEQYDITPEGNKVTVNIFKPPAFFPMSWAINQTPNTYFFAALTDVKLKQADAAATVEFLRDNQEVAFDLLSRVYRGTDALLKRLVLAARGIASNRLIFELLIEGYRFGKEINENQRLIKIRQVSLAERSGLARETVSRELRKLEEAGMITIKKEGVVLNLEDLEAQLELTI